MLKRGLEGGLVAGIGIAIGIALANVAFLGLFLGTRGLRWLCHRNRGVKLAGFSLCLFALTGGVYGNLGVAHYRDLLSGGTPEFASRLAIEALHTRPFEIADILSGILFVLGFFFCLGAAVDGFKMDDPYPGYGRLARRWDRAHEAYVNTKNDLLNDLESIRDDSLAAVRQAKASLEVRRSERATILQARRDKQQAPQRRE